MAGINAAEEFVATAGIIATAPLGATAPTSAVSVLPGAYVDHGLTTAAGITRSEPVASTPRYAWQNNTRLRTLVTTAAVRWQTVLVQSSLENIELFWGTDLVAGSLVVDPSREYPHLALVVDLTDGETTHREYAPDVQIVERGDQVAVAGDTYGWPVTLETVYNEDIGGHSVIFLEEFETPAIPTLSAATPSGVAVTGLVKIVGTGFSTVIGAAGVKFGATNATSYEVVDDDTIYAVMPAGSAGSAAVTVTNPGGTSTPLAYTRGA